MAAMDVVAGAVAAGPEARPRRVQRVGLAQDLDPPVRGVAEDLAPSWRDRRRRGHRRRFMRRRGYPETVSGPASSVLSSSADRDPGRERRGAHGRGRARSSSRSATRPTRSSRSSRARSRSSTPPATRSSATAPRGFLGEMNLLSGQTVFLTAVVTEPMRYIAVEREVLRRLLFEDAALADLLLSDLRRAGASCSRARGDRRRDHRPRDSAGHPAPGRVRAPQRLPHSWRDPSDCDGADRRGTRPGAAAAGAPARRRRAAAAEQRRALARARHRARAGAARGGRPAGRRRRAGRPRRRGLRRLGGPRHAGDREHGARRPGRDLAADRELPRLPGRDQRHRADQPRDHPGAQVRRPDGDAVPGRQRSSRATTVTWSRSRTATRSRARAVVLATGAEYRRLPVDDLDAVRGDQRLLRRRPARGASSAAPSGSPSSAAATRPARRRSGSPAAARSSPCCTAARTWPRRCRNYLIDDLERYGVAVRDRSEIAELHGTDGAARGASRCRRRRGSPSPSCSCSSARSPCTDWLGDAVARDEKGFVLTGSRAGARRPARDERPRRLRGRRRALGLDQALRDGRRRGRDRGPLRARAPRRAPATAGA